MTTTLRNGQRCYVSFFMNRKECTDKMTAFLRQKLDSAGLQEVSFDIDEFDYNMGLTFDDNERFDTPLVDLGFNNDAYDNYNRVLQMMLDSSVDHTIDHDTNGIAIELHSEAERIMNPIAELFEEIDDLDREETKQRISKIYKDLKERYGW